MGLSPNHKSKSGPLERKKRIAKYNSSHAKLGREIKRQNMLADDHILERDRHDELVADYRKKATEMVAKQNKLEEDIGFEEVMEQATLTASCEAHDHDMSVLHAYFVVYDVSEEDARETTSLVTAMYMTQTYATEHQMIEYTKEADYGSCGDFAKVKACAVKFGFLVEDTAGGTWAFNSDKFGELLYCCGIYHRVPHGSMDICSHTCQSVLEAYSNLTRMIITTTRYMSTAYILT